MPSATSTTEDEEPTVQHDAGPVGSPMFSWALPNESERPTSGNSATLKLIAIVLVGLVMVSLALFMLTRSASRMVAVTTAQPSTPEAQANSSPAPGAEVKSNVANEAPTQRTSAAVRPEDDELNKLRKRRNAATAADRSAILQAFARAEKQYPNDYRFPYERAKLAVMGPQSRSHDEAFSALSLAAEKAINSGKAREMLDGLEADKSGDFRKLSHGHYEWYQLAEALKNKDLSFLIAKVKF
jgi:hypothetical protein